MNLHVPDDNTYSIEIGIDAEEADLGVVGGRCIRWKHMTVYVYELAGGRMVGGLGVHFDPDIARAYARRNAINYLQRQRVQPARVPPNPQQPQP